MEFFLQSSRMASTPDSTSLDLHLDFYLFVLPFGEIGHAFNNPSHVTSAEKQAV